MAAVIALSVLFSALPGAWSAATFTIKNECGYTVWPGLLSSAGSAPLSTTGFALAPGESRAVAAPAGWSGRMWARTLCAAEDGGRFACGTGDCGSGDVECGGGGAAPPSTLAEFTLDGSGGLDFFDVSLVDGYNLPMLVAPVAASATGANGSGASSSSGKCAATGCAAELNGACPADLRVASASASAPAVACRSACDVFGEARYCCSGAYGSPSACRPSAYSEFFKAACPRAYSYAYDDSTSTFTCAAGATNYAVTFCPAATAPASSVKSSGQNPQAAGLLPVNATMVYFGGGSNALQVSVATTTASNFLFVAVVAVAVVLLL